MPPTRAAESSRSRVSSPAAIGSRPLRLGPLARLEAWWWTGPLGHFVAGALDLVPLLARLWLHAARRRVARRLFRARGRSGR